MFLVASHPIWPPFTTYEPYLLYRVMTDQSLYLTSPHMTPLDPISTRVLVVCQCTLMFLALSHPIWPPFTTYEPYLSYWVMTDESLYLTSPHMTPYDPLRPHINRCTCCWSVLAHVPCGIPPHMTPFHHLRTIFCIWYQHMLCSISHPHPLWPPKTPYQPQSLDCLSYPTPYDPLSPPINHISYIESWLINLFSLPHPIWPTKTPYQPVVD